MGMYVRVCVRTRAYMVIVCLCVNGCMIKPDCHRQLCDALFLSLFPFVVCSVYVRICMPCVHGDCVSVCEWVYDQT